MLQCIHILASEEQGGRDLSYGRRNAFANYQPDGEGGVEFVGGEFDIYIINLSHENYTT